jgi:hypothetical protein
MSKRRDPRGSAPSSTPSTPPPPATATTPAPPPFRPLPRLFTALLIGFAIWLGVLLTLYYRTVYPMRHHPSAGAATTLPGASALPSAPR